MNWIDNAICFDIGLCPIHSRQVFIEARDQLDNTRLWVVKMERSRGWILGKDAEWYFEPNPSDRSDEFIQLTRFGSYQQAYDYWLQNVKEFKPLYINH